MIWRIASLALVTMACSSGAYAMSSCEGTYSAAPIHPLPKQVVVGLDIHDNSPRNLRLADRFLDGVREAGVAAGAQPTVLLHISTSRLNEAYIAPDRRSEPSYPELSELRGRRSPELPPIPTYGLTSQRPAPAPPMLFLRIDATAAKETRISWIASLQCRLIGSDDDQLSRDLGRLIGGALGKEIVQSRF